MLKEAVFATMGMDKVATTYLEARIFLMKTFSESVMHKFDSMSFKSGR